MCAGDVGRVRAPSVCVCLRAVLMWCAVTAGVSVWPVSQHAVHGSVGCSSVLCGSVYVMCLEADSVR